MGSAGGRRRSVPRARLPGGAGGVGAASAPRAGCVPRLVLARDGERLVGAVPALPQDQQLRRVHLRLGAGPNAAHRSRRPLLPEAGRGDPVHAGDGPAAAGGPDLPDADVAAVTAALLRGVARGRRRRARVVGAFPVLHRAREGGARPAAELPAAPPHAVSLAQPRRATVRELRRLPDDVPLAQPQAGAQGAAGGGGARPDASAPRRAPSWTTRDWEALHALLRRPTSRRHGGIAYLQPNASSSVARETLAHRLVATLAYRGTEPVAGTINFEKGRAPLRPLLGLPGRLPDAALRALLLPADRARDRARLHAVRGGRAGRAQAQARPGAGVHPQRALDPRPGSRPARSPAFIEREAIEVAEEARIYEQHSPFRATGAADGGDNDGDG